MLVGSALDVGHEEKEANDEPKGELTYRAGTNEDGKAYQEQLLLLLHQLSGWVSEPCEQSLGPWGSRV